MCGRGKLRKWTFVAEVVRQVLDQPGFLWSVARHVLVVVGRADDLVNGAQDDGCGGCRCELLDRKDWQSGFGRFDGTSHELSREYLRRLAIAEKGLTARERDDDVVRDTFEVGVEGAVDADVAEKLVWRMLAFHHGSSLSMGVSIYFQES